MHAHVVFTLLIMCMFVYAKRIYHDECFYERKRFLLKRSPSEQMVRKWRVHTLVRRHHVASTLNTTPFYVIRSGLYTRCLWGVRLI